MKTKYRYLGIALLSNLILFAIIWWMLNNMFILKGDQFYSSLFIIFTIWTIVSINDAKADELKDKVEELEKRDKYKLL